MEPKFLPTNAAELAHLLMSESSVDIKKAFRITNESVDLIDNWAINNLEFLISESIITDCELVVADYITANPEKFSLTENYQFDDISTFYSTLESFDSWIWRLTRFTFNISNLFLDDKTKIRWHVTYADLKERLNGSELHRALESLPVTKLRILS